MATIHLITTVSHTAASGFATNLLRLCMLFYFAMISHANNPMEDHLETEIDPREPRSFQIGELLSTRQGAFDHMTRYDPNLGHEVSWHINNWEVFATSYWYETRVVNTTCPVTPQGIAAACDWALMVPCLFGNISQPPKTIFVHTLMLPHFSESTLNFLPRDYRFILISGGTDQTIPDSSGDGRYRPLRKFYGRGSNFQGIYNSPSVVHWFAENKDAWGLEKITPLPTGMATPHDTVEDVPFNMTPIAQRKLAVLSADRVRDGQGQWRKRGEVANYCKQTPWCIYSAGLHPEGLNHSSFMELLASVPFVACVQGGGIDPSPKAWESIFVGTIPIIERSPVSESYEHLPVAFVNNWGELFSNVTRGEEMLKHWLKELAPYYEHGSVLRQRTLDRLKTSYWIDKFHHKLKTELDKELDDKLTETHSYNHSFDAAASAPHSNRKKNRERILEMTTMSGMTTDSESEQLMQEVQLVSSGDGSTNAHTDVAGVRTDTLHVASALKNGINKWLPELLLLHSWRETAAAVAGGGEGSNDHRWMSATTAAAAVLLLLLIVSLAVAAVIKVISRCSSSSYSSVVKGGQQQRRNCEDVSSMPRKKEHGRDIHEEEASYAQLSASI